jgi:RNA polymerase primary sigma factor
MKQLKITIKITSRDSFSIDRYLQEISKLPLLKEEEEVELSRRIKAGDQKALDRLTKSNLRFVVSVAKQYQNQGLSLNDLINEGNIGLIRAATKFDETKGFKFISYAVWWIRQSIMQALIEQPRVVRLPMNKATTYNKLSRVVSEFEQKHEREPSTEELAELMDMRPDELHALKSCLSYHVSVDQPIGQDEDTTIADQMTSDTIPRPDTALDKESAQQYLDAMMDLLSDREQEILLYYYGFKDCNQHYSLDEIGEKMELTRERVRQLKDKALKKIRKAALQKDLKEKLVQ